MDIFRRSGTRTGTRQRLPRADRAPLWVHDLTMTEQVARLEKLVGVGLFLMPTLVVLAVALAWELMDLIPLTR